MLGPLPDINATERKVDPEEYKRMMTEMDEMLFQEGLGAQKTRAMKIFKRIDKDGTGHIDADEMPAMMRAIGLNVSDVELKRSAKKVLRKLDGDGSGTLDFNEFFFFYQHVIADEKKRRKYAAKLEKKALSNEEKAKGRAAFAKYDVDSSGTMSVKELRRVIEEELMLQLTPAEIQSLAEDIVRRGDKDGNGQIDEPEFLNFYSQCLANDEKRKKYIQKLEARYDTVMAIPDDALLG